MCEYIILENFRMDKYKYDESNGLWYELKGDYYFPCLILRRARASLSGSEGSGINAICRSTGRSSTRSC